jgi:septal ring factor EnvC (AmiA/AmiB activator)
MNAIEKIDASVAKLHGDERTRAAKYAAYLAWLKKSGRK